VVGFLNSASADGYAIAARAFRQGLKGSRAHSCGDLWIGNSENSKANPINSVKSSCGI
jgi:hypothetical protein